MGAVAFLAGVVTIVTYFEQSQTPSWAGEMISSVLSPELLTLAYHLLFLSFVMFGL